MKWAGYAVVVTAAVAILSSGGGMKVHYNPLVPCHPAFNEVSGEIIWVGDCNFTTAGGTAGSTAGATSSTGETSTSTGTTSSTGTSGTTGTTGTNGTTGTTGSTNGGLDGGGGDGGDGSDLWTDAEGTLRIMTHSLPIGPNENPTSSRLFALGYASNAPNPETWWFTPGAAVARAYVSLVGEPKSVGNPPVPLKVLAVRWDNYILNIWTGLWDTYDPDKWLVGIETDGMQRRNQPVFQNSVREEGYIASCDVLLEVPGTQPGQLPNRRWLTVSQKTDYDRAWIVGGPINLDPVNWTELQTKPGQTPRQRPPARDGNGAVGPIHLQNFGYDPVDGPLGSHEVFRQAIQMARLRFQNEQPAGTAFSITSTGPSKVLERAGGGFRAATDWFLTSPVVSEADGLLPPIAGYSGDVVLAATGTSLAGSIKPVVKLSMYLPILAFGATDPDTIADPSVGRRVVNAPYTQFSPPADFGGDSETYYSCTGHKPELIEQTENSEFIAQVANPAGIHFEPSLLPEGVTRPDIPGVFGAGRRFSYRLKDSNGVTTPCVWVQEVFRPSDPDTGQATLPRPPQFKINTTDFWWSTDPLGNLKFDYVAAWFSEPHTYELFPTSPSVRLVHSYIVGSRENSITNGNFLLKTLRMTMWTNKVIHEFTVNK